MWKWSSRHGGQELRVGSAGVPLALAKDVHRRVVVNREPPRKAWAELELSDEVGRRMTTLLRRHGLPSQKRLIVLSLNYPERTYAEIASAFSTSVDVVEECARLAPAIRHAEPLSTELWEDITEQDVQPQEVAARAGDVRSTWRGNELDEGPVPERVVAGAQGRASLGGSAARAGLRHSPRHQARPPGSQPKKGLLSDAGRRRSRGA